MHHFISAKNLGFGWDGFWVDFFHDFFTSKGDHLFGANLGHRGLEFFLLRQAVRCLVVEMVKSNREGLYIYIYIYLKIHHFE